MIDAPAMERLAARLAPGGRLLGTWPLRGGMSATMSVLELAHADGRTEWLVLRLPGAAALRRNPAAVREEHALLTQLRARGLAVPAPRLLDETGAIFPTPYVVTEYIDGAPLYAPADPTAAGHQIAAQLATLHALDPAELALPFLDAHAGPPALPTLAATALPTAVISAALAPRWPPPPPRRRALLHGDLWPGNLLWRDDRLIAIVDWEDAYLGDPLADLAITRLELYWIYGPAATAALSAAYLAHGTMAVAALPLWDLYAALRLARLVGDDLASWAAFFQPLGRPDISAASISAHYQSFTAAALSQIG